jgi:hypothetical protein
MAPADASAVDSEESRVEVYVTTDTSAAPHKADEPRLYVMYDAANPTARFPHRGERDAFVLVKDGEFDLDESGNLPPSQPGRLRRRGSPELRVPGHRLGGIQPGYLGDAGWSAAVGAPRDGRSPSCPGLPVAAGSPSRTRSARS